MLLSTKELAVRWKISPSTIRKWRVQKKGPKYIRIGGTVRYRIEDVQEYETRIVVQ